MPCQVSADVGQRSFWPVTQHETKQQQVWQKHLFLCEIHKQYRFPEFGELMADMMNRIMILRFEMPK